MRRILTVTVALLAVTAAPASAARCQKAKGETVVARSSASIVTRSGKTSTDWVYRACLFARDHWYRLLQQDPTYPYGMYYVEKIKLAGPYVALASGFSQKGDAQVGIFVTDLRNGRRRGVTAGSDYYSSGGDSYTLERLALSKHGAVAWRGTHDAGYANVGETIQKVTIADSHGARVLDSGTPGSLGGPLFKNPSTVAWSRDGTGHSASAFHGLPRE